MHLPLSHRHAAKASRRRMNRDVRKLIDSTEDLLRSTASYTGAEVQEARLRLKQQLDAARDNVGDWRDYASETARRAYDDTGEYVRDHPWRAASMALGVAALVACIIGGAHRR